MKSEKFKIKESDVLDFKRKKIVRTMATKAIRNGVLKRPDQCQICGTSGIIHAHHVDYGKPLDVMWLCAECHGRAHRKDSPYNPKNNPQTEFPSVCDHFSNVSLSFSLPTDVFLALRYQAAKNGKRVSTFLRELIMNNHPIDTGQLEFKFMELYDKSLEKSNEGIQSLSTHEGSMPQPERSTLPEIWGQRNLNLHRMEKRFYEVPLGHGANASDLQRTGTH